MAEANSSEEIKKYNIGNSLENLESNAERVKCEINTKLDNLIETINTERKNILNRIDSELSKARDELKKSENRTSARLSAKERMAKDLAGDDELIAKISKDIDEELERMNDELPKLKMEWNPNIINLFEDDEKIGRLNIYYSQSRFAKSNPIWSTLNKGRADNELSGVKAIAIDTETSNIYVGDASEGKILILNSTGEYQNNLKFKKPSSIGDMTICQNYIYCTSNGFWVNTIYQIDKNTGELLNKYNHGKTIDSFTASDQIYFCGYTHLSILKLNLTVWNEIQIKYPHILYGILVLEQFRIRNIKCINDELVMQVTELKDHSNPIHIFSKEGLFQRAIGGDLPVLSSMAEVYMCIDEQWKIILSTNEQVNVYSKDGKFITSVGTKGDDRDGIYEPRGIALDKDGNLLVCNNRSRNILQAY